MATPIYTHSADTGGGNYLLFKDGVRFDGYVTKTQAEEAVRRLNAPQTRREVAKAQAAARRLYEQLSILAESLPWGEGEQLLDQGYEHLDTLLMHLGVEDE